MIAAKRKLLQGISFLVLLSASAMVWCEGTGFFFNGTGVLDLEPTLAQARGETLYGDLVGLGGATLGLGFSSSVVDVSLNGGYGLKTQFPSYDELQTNGLVMRRYVQEDSHEVPAFLKLAFRIPLGSSFTLKPHLFSGMVFTFSPDRDKAKDWQDPSPDFYTFKAGAGLDLAFAFPGDKISLFVGAEFNATVGLFSDWTLPRWGFSPSVRGGVTFYPVRGTAKTPTVKGPPDGSKEIKGNEWTPSLLLGRVTVKEGTVPVIETVQGDTFSGASPTAAPGAPRTGNLLLAAVRGRETYAAALPPAIRPLNNPGPTQTGAQTPAAPTFTNRSFNIDGMLKEIRAMQADVAELKDDLIGLDK